MGNGGVANMQPSAMGNYQQQMGDYMNNLQPSACLLNHSLSSSRRRCLGTGTSKDNRASRCKANKSPACMLRAWVVCKC